jgi:threonine synthase
VPLDAAYDYDRVRHAIGRTELSDRPHNLWRWPELLPVAAATRVGAISGWTPLLHAQRLGAHIGLERLYLKLDIHSAPTFSYKDRVVAVAVQHAVQSGATSIGCVSTGNVGNSLAALAAMSGLRAAVFYPRSIDRAKRTLTRHLGAEIFQFDGNYDETNALARDLAGSTGVPFVNITLRPYYAEGAKTLALEVLEQLDWRPPEHVVVPVAGTTLIRKTVKGFREALEVGLTSASGPRVHAAQAGACAPIADALSSGRTSIVPCRPPSTIAESLAIGAPAEGDIAVGEVRAIGGTGAAVSDDAILEAMVLLARYEGVFAEPAGATPLAAAVALRERGVIAPGETVVVTVTGNGFKSLALVERAAQPPSELGGRGEVESSFRRWLVGSNDT